MTPRGNGVSLENLMKGADGIVRIIGQYTDTIFGVNGGASLETFDAIGRVSAKYGVSLVDTAKEDGAGFAASGYARSSGNVGVVITTSGPGATNALTPITDASLDSVPIVFISGQVFSHLLGKGSFQEASVSEMSRPHTKASYLVTKPNELSDVLEEAFFRVTEGRHGPVHVDVTKDVTRVITPLNDRYNHPVLSPHEINDKVNIIYQKLKESRRPVLYVGGGVISSGAYRELREFSELTGIPVTTTLMGLGSFSQTDKNSLGMLGMHGTAYSNFAINGSPLNDYKDGADLLLAIGARFDDRITGDVKEFAKRAYIVHVDVDEKENGKNKTPNIFVNSDAKLFLAALSKMIRQEGGFDYSRWLSHIDVLKVKYPLKINGGFDERGMEIPTQYVIKKLYEITRDMNPIITTGVGQHQMWAAQYFLVDRPRKFLTSGGLGSMGYGTPAAIGAQAANPDQLVIDLDGDRSFWMTNYELETIARFDLPVKVVIFDNDGHGMVKQWQDLGYEGRWVASNYKNVNFAEYAGIFRDGNGQSKIKSRRINRLDQVDDALREMITHKGPYVLHIDVKYEHCLPMLPAGKTVKEMLL